MDQREKRIMVEIEHLRQDLLDFLARLVTQDSTLGNEAGVLRLFEDELAAIDLEPRRVPIEPQELAKQPGFAPVLWDYEDRYNLVATRPADASGGKSALFCSHLDVVSPEPMEAWNNDPYEPLARDGWFYGRGAGDMKAGAAAMVYALWAVSRAGFGLSAPVSLAGVIEEECSGNGALACVRAGVDAQAVLIPEPFGPTILTHQLGVLWFKITVTGTPVHVLEAGSGVNAVEKMFVIMSALRALETSLNEKRPHPYNLVPHPINLNLGVIRGGDWPSTVPARCELHGRLSYYPGQSFEEIRQQVEKTVHASAAADSWLVTRQPVVEFYGFRSDGFALEADLPQLETLDVCHQELCGEEAEVYLATCTTDCRAWNQFGQGVATCYGPVAENIHAANERVDINSIMHTAKAYALFLSRWCGLVE